MIERTFRCLSFSQVVGWSHFQISTVSVSLDCHRPRNVIYFLKATYDQQISDFHFPNCIFLYIPNKQNGCFPPRMHYSNKVWMRQETFLDSRQNWTGKLTTQSRLKVGWKKIYWVIKFWQRMIPSCILKVYPAYASSELCEFISLASSCVHRQTEAKISRASIWIHIWPTVNFTDWAEPRVCMQIQPKQYCSNKLHTAGHLPHC